MREMNTKENEIKERHLLLIDNPVKQVVELISQVTVLGRDSSKDIVIKSDLISREHATFLRINTSNPSKYDFRIIDGAYKKERSKNGIFVNEKRCYTHDLKHGDVLSFGDVIQGIYLKLELNDEGLQECMSDLMTVNEINKDTLEEIGAMNPIYCTKMSYLSEHDPTSIMLGG